jgi:hypothetical protein
VTVLVDLTASSGAWPLAGHSNRIAVQRDYQTLYNNRRAEILQRWSGDLLRWSSAQEDLVPYPSAKIAAKTLSAFLFGEDPTITYESEALSTYLEAMATGVALNARLLEGAITQAVQGEIYMRPAWDRDLSPHPIPTMIPGAQVIPKFLHGILVDAAIVTTYVTDEGQYHYRHFEHHAPGLITNVLYRGQADRLGRLVPLTEIAQTRSVEEEIDTEVDELLIVHVPLGRDATSPHGVSLFDGLEGLILALHRLYSQEQHDAELARKRIAMPESFVSRDASGRASFDRGTDLLVLGEEAEGPIGSDRNPITTIEFSDDLVMRDRIRGRLEDFLIACGISPQTVNASDAGSAPSGTSRKLAQASTLQTVAAAGRYWQDAISQTINLSMKVGAAHLGYDLTPADLQIMPSVKLADGLLEDAAEAARILLDLDTAEAISTIEKVRRVHPEWSLDQVMTEVELITGENPAIPSLPATDALGRPDDEDPEG